MNTLGNVSISPSAPLVCGDIQMIRACHKKLFVC